MSGPVAGDAHLPTSILAALDRLGRARRLHRQAVASTHGLTVLQLDLLLALASGLPREPSVGALAREIGVSQPTATDSLRSLERKGLVSDVRGVSDRRRRLRVLTADGQRLVAAAERGDGAARAAVTRLPLDRQETTLEALLGVIASFVDEGVIDVARTCLTCHFHQATADGGHRCTLLDAEIAPAELRVNCPEHVPAGA